MSSERESREDEWAPLRKARKDHRCTHCGRRIPKGRMYHATRVTPWDHPDNEGFAPYKAHRRCHAFWLKTGDWSDWMFWDDHHGWRREMAHERLERMRQRTLGPREETDEQ